MPDVQDPDGLPGFIHFVEDATGVFPIAKEKASDLAARFSGFTSEGAPIGKLFETIEAVNEFLEPLRPSDRRSPDHPIVDLIRIGLGRLTENDMVGHVLVGTPFQTASVALHDRLPHLRVRA